MCDNSIMMKNCGAAESPDVRKHGCLVQTTTRAEQYDLEMISGIFRLFCGICYIHCVYN